MQCMSEMCCTRLAEIQEAKFTQKNAICAPSHNVGLCLRNEGIHRQSEKRLLNSNTSSTCSQNMVNFGPLTAEISWRVWGTPADFNGFHVLASFVSDIAVFLLKRDVKLQLTNRLGFVTAPTSLNGGQPHFARCLAVSWAGTLYIFLGGGGVLPPNGILPGAKFTLRPSLAFSYIGSVTAGHSSSGCQLNFVAW